MYLIVCLFVCLFVSSLSCIFLGGRGRAEGGGGGGGGGFFVIFV